MTNMSFNCDLCPWIHASHCGALRLRPGPGPGPSPGLYPEHVDIDLRETLYVKPDMGLALLPSALAGMEGGQTGGLAVDYLWPPTRSEAVPLAPGRARQEQAAVAIEQPRARALVALALVQCAPPHIQTK